MIQIVIMASGLSRRMGSDKLFANLGGKPVLKWVIDAAAKTGNKEVYVVYRNPLIADIAEYAGVKLIYNPWNFLGQSATIRVAAESLIPAKPILFIPGDQPLITSETLLMMIEKFEESSPDILCASWRGERSMPALFSGTMTSQLMTLEGDTGGRSLITSGLYRVAFQELLFEEEQWDIDTLEDLKRIEQWCEANGRREV